MRAMSKLGTPRRGRGRAQETVECHWVRVGMGLRLLLLGRSSHLSLRIDLTGLDQCKIPNLLLMKENRQEMPNKA